MATLKVPISDFYLESSWKASWVANGQLVYSQKPTTGTATKSFAYELPSGVKITGAQVVANLNNPLSGASFVKVGGSSQRTKVGSAYAYPVTVSDTSGTLSVKFSFKANGGRTGEHHVRLTLKNVYLEIAYEVQQIQKAATQTQQGEGFTVPPQSVCIYDQTDGEIYMFDGVTKIQHSLSMDIQEEPESKKKDKYVNNARNNPDKLTIDVVMSDVYTGGGAIITKAEDNSDQQTKSGNAASQYLMGHFARSEWTRSEAAARTLHWLKEERRKLSVITPQYVHVDMILSTVTINQDDNTPFGWEGQLVFQHAYEPKVVKNTNSKRETTETVPDPSVARQSGINMGDGSSTSSSQTSSTEKSAKTSLKKAAQNAIRKAFGKGG